MHLWRSDYSPFIRWARLDYCRRLIVVPMTTFHRPAELIGDPKGELIFLFNTARCGSTILTRVDQFSQNHWLSINTTRLYPIQNLCLFAGFRTEIKKFIKCLQPMVDLQYACIKMTVA